MANSTTCIDASFLVRLLVPERFSGEAAREWMHWQLAKHFNQQRTYDMAYLALAEQNNCPFWTAGERLYNSVRHQLPWVHWIGSPGEKP